MDPFDFLCLASELQTITNDSFVREILPSSSLVKIESLAIDLVDKGHSPSPSADLNKQKGDEKAPVSSRIESPIESRKLLLLSKSPPDQLEGEIGSIIPLPE